MKINDLVVSKEIDAKIDTAKKRLEIQLDGEDGGKIIAYYPLEHLQIYIYEINGGQIPDLWELGLRMDYSGRYTRILVCRYGRGEFNKDGLELNMSGGEFALRYGIEEENRFMFTGDSVLGIEFVLQVDHAAEENFLLKMLKTTMGSIGIQKENVRENQWYFSNYSEETEMTIDRMIANCVNGADSAMVMINAAEVSYDLGRDFRDFESKERKYPTNTQKAIAADMHRQLTENYDERITAAMFAEKYGLSDTTVKSYFKNVYGYGYKEYQMKVRMEKAAEMLKNTDMKQVEIAMAVGYSTQAKFIGAFKKYYNMKPSEYRRLKKLGDILG